MNGLLLFQMRWLEEVSQMSRNHHEVRELKPCKYLRKAHPSRGSKGQSREGTVLGICKEQQGDQCVRAREGVERKSERE